MRFLRFPNQFCRRVTQQERQLIFLSRYSPTLSIWSSFPVFQRQKDELCRNVRLFAHLNWWSHECCTFYQLNCTIQINAFDEIKNLKAGIKHLVFYFIMESTNGNPNAILHCKFWITFDQGTIHILSQLKWLSVWICNIITCFWQKHDLIHKWIYYLLLITWHKANLL